MVIYRPHRGGLAESLLEAREFQTFDDMKKYIYQTTWDDFGDLGLPAPFEMEDIVINEENKGNDDRCGWRDTMRVCVKRFGDEDYMKEYGTPKCIGMCATDYPHLIPFGFIDRLYFVSKENDKYILYDDRKILILDPDEEVLSVAKMAWENSQ